MSLPILGLKELNELREGLMDAAIEARREAVETSEGKTTGHFDALLSLACGCSTSCGDDEMIAPSSDPMILQESTNMTRAYLLTQVILGGRQGIRLATPSMLGDHKYFVRDEMDTGIEWITNGVLTDCPLEGEVAEFFEKRLPFYLRAFEGATKLKTKKFICTKYRKMIGERLADYDPASWTDQQVMDLGIAYEISKDLADRFPCAMFYGMPNSRYKKHKADYGFFAKIWAANAAIPAPKKKWCLLGENDCPSQTWGEGDTLYLTDGQDGVIKAWEYDDKDFPALFADIVSEAAGDEENNLTVTYDVATGCITACSEVVTEYPYLKFFVKPTGTGAPSECDKEIKCEILVRKQKDDLRPIFVPEEKVTRENIVPYFDQVLERVMTIYGDRGVGGAILANFRLLVPDTWYRWLTKVEKNSITNMDKETGISCLGLMESQVESYPALDKHKNFILILDNQEADEAAGNLMLLSDGRNESEFLDAENWITIKEVNDPAKNGGKRRDCYIHVHAILPYGTQIINPSKITTNICGGKWAEMEAEGLQNIDILKQIGCKVDDLCVKPCAVKAIVNVSAETVNAVTVLTISTETYPAGADINLTLETGVGISAIITGANQTVTLDAEYENVDWSLSGSLTHTYTDTVNGETVEDKCDFEACGDLSDC